MDEDKELRRLSMKLGSALNKYGFVNDYWITLENMSENYDFILEDIDPGAFTGWSDDKITEKASEMLRVTGELFEKMLEDCERDLLDAVAGIAALGEEKAKLVWEDTVSWEELVDMDAEEIYMRLTGGEEEEITKGNGFCGW